MEEPRMPGLPETAQALAKAQADGDRAMLAKLRAEGMVRRSDGAFEARHPQIARPFIRDIEKRADALRPGADTIRPNPKNRKKGRR